MSLDRRGFLQWTSAAGLALATGRRAAAAPEPPTANIRALTTGPKHHFFGYYGMPPWNRSGSRIVCLESDFQDHMPKPEEPGTIGVIDTSSGQFEPVSTTRAWNFQQGALLHWNPLDPENEVIHNDREGTDVIARVLNVSTGEKRALPRPVSAVCREKPFALSLTYGRLTRLRPVVGYVGLEDPNPDDPHPANDGVFRMDLTTGKADLIVTIDQVYRLLIDEAPVLAERHMWFNHTVVSDDDGRFLFLARSWNEGGGKRQLESAMLTANLDGSDLRRVIPFQIGVSHFDWRSPREIIATFPLGGKSSRHVLFTDGEGNYRILGKKFFGGDGHCTYSPDGKWLASDPSDGRIQGRRLLLFDMESEQGVELAAFRLGEYLNGDLRCDLHPRWSRSGDAICFDAIDQNTGLRQLHLAELQLPG